MVSIETVTRTEATPMLRNDVHATAHAIALERQHRVLVLTGKLDGPNGLPSSVSQHGDGIQLRLMSQYTQHIPMGLFEVINEDSLCAVIDQLQITGGYKATVIDENGRSDPAYML